MPPKNKKKYFRNYYKINKVTIIERQINWNAAHPDVLKKAQKKYIPKWRKKNRKKYNKYQSKYQKESRQKNNGRKNK